MRQIGHFIGGKEVAGSSGRAGDVFNPNTGEVQAKVAFAKQFRGRACDRQRRGRAAGLGRDQSAAARAGALQVPGARAEGIRQPRQAPLLRARQDHRRLQGRHPARARSGGVRLRHPAPDEGRVQRERRARHRPVLDPPAARRRRRHHAVQFPGHDPDVEIRPRARLRQRLHPQAVGARPLGADAARRAADRGRAARRRAQRGQRRQGGGRHAAHRSAHHGDRLRRLLGDRRIHLFHRHRERKTRAVLRRRQEPHGGDAGRRHRPGGRCADRRGLRLGRRALHGDLGGGAGRQEDRRHSGREAHPASREPQGRAFDRPAGRLRPDGHQGASGEGQGLRRARE